MRCASHISVEMVFIPYEAAKGVKRGSISGQAAEELEILITRKGILRCPVAGCSFVAHPPIAPEPRVRLCPSCGAVTDSTQARRSTYDYRCKKCIDALSAKRAKAVRMEHERYLKKKVQKVIDEKRSDFTWNDIFDPASSRADA